MVAVKHFLRNQDSKGLPTGPFGESPPHAHVAAPVTLAQSLPSCTRGKAGAGGHQDLRDLLSEHRPGFMRILAFCRQLAAWAKLQRSDVRDEATAVTESPGLRRTQTSEVCSPSTNLPRRRILPLTGNSLRGQNLGGLVPVIQSNSRWLTICPSADAYDSTNWRYASLD